MNLDVNSQKTVDTYLKLFNYKVGNSGKFKIKNINSPNGYCRNEFRAETLAKDVVVSIYNKKAQLIDIKRVTEAERAEGILRVEVQLKRHSTIMKHFPEAGSNVNIIKAAVRESRNMIKKTAFKVVDPDDYCKMNEAVDLVLFNVDKKTMSRRMVRLLELTSKKHSLKLAKEALFKEDKKITKAYYRKMMREFHDLNLNIVTLGRRCSYDTLKGVGSLMSE